MSPTRQKDSAICKGDRRRARTRTGASPAGDTADDTRATRASVCRRGASADTPSRMPDGRTLVRSRLATRTACRCSTTTARPGRVALPGVVGRRGRARDPADRLRPRGVRRFGPPARPHGGRRRGGRGGDRRRARDRSLRDLGRLRRRPARAGVRGAAGRSRRRRGDDRRRGAVRRSRPRLHGRDGRGQRRGVRSGVRGRGDAAPAAGGDGHRDARRHGGAARRGAAHVAQPARRGRRDRRAGASSCSTRSPSESAAASTAGSTTISPSSSPGASTRPRSRCRFRSGRASRI